MSRLHAGAVVGLILGLSTSATSAIAQEIAPARCVALLNRAIVMVRANDAVPQVERDAYISGTLEVLIRDYTDRGRALGNFDAELAQQTREVATLSGASVSTLVSVCEIQIEDEDED